MLYDVRFKLKAIETDKLKAVFRADIDASAAQDAEASILDVPFEDRIDSAVQASLRLQLRALLVEVQLHFGHAGAAIERQCGNRLP